jgi:hypothetical protein
MIFTTWNRSGRSAGGLALTRAECVPVARAKSSSFGSTPRICRVKRIRCDNLGEAAVRISPCVSGSARQTGREVDRLGALAAEVPDIGGTARSPDQGS